MELLEQRKSEIEEIIDKILAPYNSNLEEFSLEKIREQYNFKCIYTSRLLDKKYGSMVYSCLDLYFIIFSEGVEITLEAVGHEIAHIILNHKVIREIKRFGQPIDTLTGFQFWWRTEVKKYPDPFPKYGDTPQENAEANYFSQYWNKRLEGVGWLRDIKIISLD